MKKTVLKRQKKLKKKINQQEAAGMVISVGPDMGYLSGFEYEKKAFEVFLLLSPAKEPMFVAPKLMEEQLENHSYIDSIEVWQSPKKAYDTIKSYFGQTEGKVLLDDFMYHAHGRKIEEKLDRCTESGENLLQELKQEKLPEEIEVLEKAAEITDLVIEDLRSEDVIGMTEKEVADLILSKFREKGGEEPAFRPIVAAGENGSEVFHKPGDKVIEEGEPVVLDIGTTYENYCSDCARTLVFSGEPSKKFKDLFKTVNKGYEKALDKAKPGNTAGSVGDAARSFIEEKGYGDNYITSTGHGLGRSTHERPSVVRGNEQELKPGMVLTIEPGIYLREDFGVKVENTVVITEEGNKTINSTSKEWRT